jgi:hypothetical protein
LKEFFFKKTPKLSCITNLLEHFSRENNAFNGISAAVTLLYPLLVGGAWHRLYFYIKEFPAATNARDAIRTHEPLQEWILSPSELAGLSYPRTGIWY